MDDGRLLQPAAPARALDRMLHQLAFNASKTQEGGGEQLWGATTAILGAGTFAHVLAADIINTLSVVPADLACVNAVDSLSPIGSSFVVFENSAAGIDATAEATVAVAVAATVSPFSAAAPLVVPPCQRDDFRLFHAAPVLANGWSLLGELGKWVPTAEARFTRVDVVADSSGGEVRAHVVGARDENVTVSFADPQGQVHSTTCRVPSSLSVVVSNVHGCTV